MLLFHLKIFVVLLQVLFGRARQFECDKLEAFGLGMHAGVTLLAFLFVYVVTKTIKYLESPDNVADETALNAVRLDLDNQVRIDL